MTARERRVRLCVGCGRGLVSRAERPVCLACKQGLPPQPCVWCGRGPRGLRMYGQPPDGPICQACYQRGHRPKTDEEPMPLPGVCGSCEEERLRLDPGTGLCPACTYGKRQREERLRTPEGRAIQREIDAALERRRRHREEVSRILAEQRRVAPSRRDP